MDGFPVDQPDKFIKVGVTETSDLYSPVEVYVAVEDPFTQQSVENKFPSTEAARRFVELNFPASLDDFDSAISTQEGNKPSRTLTSWDVEFGSRGSGQAALEALGFNVSATPTGAGDSLLPSAEQRVLASAPARERPVHSPNHETGILSGITDPADFAKSNSVRVDTLQERMNANRQLLDAMDKNPEVLQRLLHTKDPDAIMTVPGSRTDNYLSYDPFWVRQRFADEDASARNWQRVQLSISVPGFGLGAGVVYLLGGGERAQDAAGLALSAGFSISPPKNVFHPRGADPKIQSRSPKFKSPKLISKGWRLNKKRISDVRRNNRTRDINPATSNEGFVKKINWPSAKDVEINIAHVMDYHHITGTNARARLQPGGSGTSLWPAEMTARQIEAVIRDAYRNIDARKSIEAGGQHVVQGTSGRFRVEMSVDVANGRINTGYWIN